MSRGGALFLSTVILSLAGACGRCDQSVAADPLPKDGIVAGYFHYAVRCKTCLAIESQAKEAVEVAFGDELSSGRLAWRVLDVEQPGNEHFAKEFGLTGSTLVLVERKDGRTVRWKSLEKTWDLVDDPAAFQEYVWTELGSFLE